LNTKSFFIKKNQSGKALFVRSGSWEEMETFKLNKMKKPNRYGKIQGFYCANDALKNAKSCPKSA
jgi:hypothetical protein